MKTYIAVLIGCIIYILFQLNSVYNKPEFKWSVFVKTNWIPVLLNLTLGFALVWGEDEMVSTLRGAMITGLGGQGLWKKITDVFDKDKKTVVNL